MLTDPPPVSPTPNEGEKGKKEDLPAKPAIGHIAANQPEPKTGNIAHPTPRLVTWRTENLRPLPCYERLGFQPSANQLSSIDALGDGAFVDPLWVTQDGYIIDGNARYQQALRSGRPTLHCLQYELTQE